MKKFFAVCLMVGILNFVSCPVMAYTYSDEVMLDMSNSQSSPVQSVNYQNTYQQTKTKSDYIMSGTKLKLSFDNTFNAKKSNIGDEISFTLNEEYTDGDGDFIPKGTRFTGSVSECQDAKWGMRNAKASFSINKMILPNGNSYYVSMLPLSDVKGNAGAGVAKGLGKGAAVAGGVLIGGTAIAVTCLSLGGALILAPLAAGAAGVSVAGTSKGVNLKIPAGTEIVFEFEAPIDIEF